MRHENFADRTIPEGFSWLNPPPAHDVDGGLWITTCPETDFWQRTDWAIQTVSSAIGQRCYRASRRGDDFLLEYGDDGRCWDQLRITHLHLATPELAVRIYACSPVGRDFRCCFRWLEIDDNHWQQE